MGGWTPPEHVQSAMNRSRGSDLDPVGSIFKSPPGSVFDIQIQTQQAKFSYKNPLPYLPYALEILLNKMGTVGR